MRFYNKTRLFFFLMLILLGEALPGAGVLILDTRNNGLELGPIATTKLLSSAFKTVHWTGAASDDAFLMIDGGGAQSIGYFIRSETGVLLDGLVLIRAGLIGEYGTTGPIRAADAWQLLRVFDQNKDSKITAADPIWPHLKLFFDDNGDGAMEGSEIRSTAIYFEIMNIGQFGADRFDSHGNLLQDGNYVTPAGFPRLVAEVTLAEEPIQPDPANGPWQANSVEISGTSEAELMVRAGDIDNLGFGWPEGFTPFSGRSSPSHSYPWQPQVTDAEGTDRIMVVTSYRGNPPNGADGYATGTLPPANRPRPIVLRFNPTGLQVTNAVLQMFVDDFQAPVWHANYTVILNGVRSPFLENILNRLQQTGPVGSMVTAQIPASFLPEVQKGELEILIDDTTTGAGDGYAIDFAKLLLNPKTFQESGSIAGKVANLAAEPLQNAIVQINGVEVRTDAAGEFSLANVAAGIVTIEASKGGYEPQTLQANLEAGRSERINFALRPSKSADLSVEIIAPPKATVGMPFEFRIIVRNLGSGAASDVRATGILPAEVQYVSSASSSGVIVVEGRSVKVAIPGIAGNSAAEILVTVNPGTRGLLTLIAGATGAEFDPTLANNSVTIEVAAEAEGNQPPQVALILQDNQQADSCAGLLLEAAAVDPDGSISKVEFMDGEVKIGEAQGPYRILWNNLVNGTHTIRAIATDNLGAKTVSSEAVIQASGPPLHQLAEAKLANRAFSFCFGVAPAANYELQGSIDLKNWVVVEAFQAVGSSHSFTETSISPAEVRWKFYRAVKLP